MNAPGLSPHSAPRTTSERKSAVLVAYAFPPLNIIGAQRALRMARVLLERYDNVYVIGLDPRELDPRLLDFEYGREVLAHPRLMFIAAKPVLNGFEFTPTRSFMQRVAGALVYRALCSHGLDWLKPLERALRHVPDDAGVRVMIATGAPFVTFAPCVRWARARGVPAILDYRDLWTRNPRAHHPRIARYVVNRVLERRLNAGARILTTVSDGCRAALERDAGATPVRVLFNAPDETYLDYYANVARRRAAARAPGEPLRIVFTGQVYAECTFAPLLRAIAALAPAQRAAIEVHYYGNCSRQVEAEFEAFGLRERLVDHGLVSKENSIVAILDADVLLSLIHADDVAADPAVTGLMTTKVYDYLLSGRPILNIGPSDAEVNVFARRIGYRPFHSYRASDLAGLQAFLEKLAGGAIPERAEPLSAALPSFADELRGILDEAERLTP